MPKSKRWVVVSGLCLILAGFSQVWEGWTALPIETDGIEALGAGVFLVFLGLCFFGVALGLVKLGGGQQ